MVTHTVPILARMAAAAAAAAASGEAVEFPGADDISGEVKEDGGMQQGWSREMGVGAFRPLTSCTVLRELKSTSIYQIGPRDQYAETIMMGLAMQSRPFKSSHTIVSLR
jgi:hypothetical protein